MSDLIAKHELEALRREPRHPEREAELEERMAELWARYETLLRGYEGQREAKEAAMEFLAAVLGNGTRSTKWEIVADLVHELRAIHNLPAKHRARVMMEVKSTIALVNEWPKPLLGRRLQEWLRNTVEVVG